MTQDEVRTLFVYESTGMLRKVVEARKPYPWRKAGKDGRYLLTTFAGKSYYLHRLIWLYHNGTTPPMLDHINGDTRDNRIENLRACTNAQNQYNSRRKSNNQSGHKGVVFHPKCTLKPWQAKVVIGGRVMSLGYYSSKEQAAAAYAAELKNVAGPFARVE